MPLAIATYYPLVSMLVGASDGIRCQLTRFRSLPRHLQWHVRADSLAENR